ncbi:MAG: serine hydrolase [Planctomycetota bacterium]|jgi:CubicO group peptidase (beta-lactamase class C family)
MMMTMASNAIGEKLEPFVMEVLESFEVPGLGIGVVKDLELAYAKGFGVKSVESEEPVTTTSLFHLASVSKPFIATAVVQLAERGAIDLDAPLVTYLPYFKVNHPRYREITVRQALNHVSGLPGVEDAQDVWDWDKPQYDDDALERYVRSLENDTLVFEPGEKFQYSNVAFEILGDIIAKVSGQSFEEYVKKNLLDPLGMIESTFLLEDVSRELMASPHVRAPQTTVSNVYPYHRSHSPSSTLHSNIHEMGNWLIANLGGGSFMEQQILEPKSHELMWKRHAVRNEENGEFAGMSWFISEYKGNRFIWHSGGDIGFITQCYMLPEKSLGVVVLCNCDYAPVAKIAQTTLDVMLGLEPDTPPKPPGLIPFSSTMAKKGLDATIEQYHQFKEEQADDYAFSDYDLEYLGNRLLSQDETNLDQALALLEFNAAEYPDSSSAYASLAKAYLKKGDKEMARSKAEKSLVLNPDNAAARRILKRLHG